jgi:YlmC/YmxH family sporulation protein
MGGMSVQCRIADLRCKEVINICNGMRMGFVSDVLVDIRNGCVVAIVVPGPCRILGLFWREDDFIIPWECIKRIGDDIILIEVSGPFKREKRRRIPWA